MSRSLLLRLKYCIVSMVFALMTMSVHAQHLDTLLAVWMDRTASDSVRVSAYNDYIWEGYLFSHPDTAVLMAEALHLFAIENHHPKASATGFTLQGIAYHIQGKFGEALDAYLQSLAIEESMGNKKGIASNLGNIGIIYKIQGNYPRALEYYERSLIIEEEIGDRNGIAGSLHNIGKIHAEQGEEDRALDYYFRAKALNEELGNKQYLANNLSTIGHVYKGQGDNVLALDYFQQSLAILEEIRDKHGISASLSDIGFLYFQMGQYDSALDYHQRALAIREEIGNNQGIAASLRGIGDVYRRQGKALQALAYCRRGLEQAQKIGVLEIQKSACACLYHTYKEMGNSRQALVYYEQMILIRDSIYNEENTRQLTRIQMQYEFERKEAVNRAEQEKKDAVALQELRRHKLARNGFVGGFLLVLSFAGVFLVQRNRIGKEKERSEELLLNILPEATAQELKVKGYADAQHIEQVTVLFTDFKGFTAISELLSPRALVEDLHECFSAFDHICEKYGIEKIKTIGDAYMAAGGLPTPNTTHAADVVNAALEMAEVVNKGKLQKQADGQPFFEVRIGVHTGPVVAGIVGVKKFQYDIWGDTVNTAARMESHSEVGKVNISQATYRLIQETPGFSFQRRGKIQAKGKGEVEMFFVSRL